MGTAGDCTPLTVSLPAPLPVPVPLPVRGCCGLSHVYRESESPLFANETLFRRGGGRARFLAKAAPRLSPFAKRASPPPSRHSSPRRPARCAGPAGNADGAPEGAAISDASPSRPRLAASSSPTAPTQWAWVSSATIPSTSLGKRLWPSWRRTSERRRAHLALPMSHSAPAQDTSRLARKRHLPSLLGRGPWSRCGGTLKEASWRARARQEPFLRPLWGGLHARTRLTRAAHMRAWVARGASEPTANIARTERNHA